MEEVWKIRWNGPGTSRDYDDTRTLRIMFVEAALRSEKVPSHGETTCTPPRVSDTERCTPDASRCAVDSELLTKLLTATAGGDRRAFSRLYELMSGRLFAIAVRVLKSHSLAEEVLQEAFLSIWEQADQHQPGRGPPVAWMSTIVRHRAIDRLRTQRNRLQELALADVAVMPSPDFDLDWSTMLDNMGDKIRDCIEKLPVSHRNALLGAFYYGLTHDELAQRFGVPLGTAKSWVRRGLRQLRDNLGE